MFTGIIEATAIVKEISENGTNKTFWIESDLSGQFKIDQSISHSGVCLTVEAINDGCHRVTAIEETLLKTNLGQWSKGSVVNLERCISLNARLDGHMVQGHVDCTALCTRVTNKNGSSEFSFSFPESFAPLIIEKGSVAVNGISLTCFATGANSFSVAIIPYTYEHTNIRTIKENDAVNIEFDVIGKYVLRSAWVEQTRDRLGQDKILQNIAL